LSVDNIIPKYESARCRGALLHRHTNPNKQLKSKATALTLTPDVQPEFQTSRPLKVTVIITATMFAKTVQRLKLLWSTTPASNFEQQLNKAQPAETPWDADTYVCAGVNIEFGKSLYCLSQPKDGLWVCHCGHENALMRVQGPHPFKFLTCGACDNVMCKRCPTTAILTRVSDKDLSDQAGPWSKGKLVRCCRICQYCGLSHRAVQRGGALVFQDTPCRCGHRALKTNQPYHIGSVEKYRMDPARQAVALSIKRRGVISQDMTPITRSQNCEPVATPHPSSTPVQPRARTQPLEHYPVKHADPALKRRRAIRRRPAD
jgi:hypothetical protein